MEFEITELYAFVAIDPEDGDEGVMGLLGPDQNWVPMVGADMTRVEELKVIAAQMASKAGIAYKLKKFKLVETIEVG